MSTITVLGRHDPHEPPTDLSLSYFRYTRTFLAPLYLYSFIICHVFFSPLTPLIPPPAVALYRICLGLEPVPNLQPPGRACSSPCIVLRPPRSFSSACLTYFMYIYSLILHMCSLLDFFLRRSLTVCSSWPGLCVTLPWPLHLNILFTSSYFLLVSEVHSPCPYNNPRSMYINARAASLDLTSVCSSISSLFCLTFNCSSNPRVPNQAETATRRIYGLIVTILFSRHLLEFFEYRLPPLRSHTNPSSWHVVGGRLGQTKHSVCRHRVKHLYVPKWGSNRART